MAVVDSELVDLIGGIYDAVLDRELWPEALDRIRQHFGLHNAVVGILRLDHESGSLRIPVNIPRYYEQAMAMPEYNEAMIDLWGGREQLARYPIEEPFALLDVSDRKTVMANPFYSVVAEPEGILDHVAMIVARDRRQLGNVAFARHRDLGPITKDVLDGMRLLAPHLRRAVLITGILEEERKTRTMLEAVLDAVRSAVVLVDRGARIIYANPVGEATIAAADPLVKAHGRLELRGEVAPGHLQVAIERAAEGDIPLGRRGIAIPGTRMDASPYVAHVMPLGDRRARSGIPGEAVAAVFVADRADDPQLVIDAATMIYNLTPTEARVFDLLVAGHASADVARELAISPNTLKWHTRQLFEKTGQHRRVDLVRLAGKLRTGQI